MYIYIYIYIQAYKFEKASYEMKYSNRPCSSQLTVDTIYMTMCRIIVNAMLSLAPKKTIFLITPKTIRSHVHPTVVPKAFIMDILSLLVYNQLIECK